MLKKIQIKQVFYACSAFCLLLLSTDILAHESQSNIGFLHPKGLVAAQQKALFFDSIALMLSVVIPVIVMSFWFAFRYRVTKKGNPHHHYEPDLKDSQLLEVIWWVVPGVIILVLGVLVWMSSHRLDPYKSLDVPGKPLQVQVIALPWKWLFIYPKQHVASLNKLVLPINRQVEFWITADAPMSSFAVPQLGSQIYAMAGMRTRLHLYPTVLGNYRGLNTQYNGAGFPYMKFVASVVSAKDFEQWLRDAQSNGQALDKPHYQVLAKPSIKDPIAVYHKTPDQLFEWVMQKYTQPPQGQSVEKTQPLNKEKKHA